MDDALTTVTEEADALPILTVAPATKEAPLIVTLVPPAVDPFDGETDFTVGVVLNRERDLAAIWVLLGASYRFRLLPPTRDFRPDHQQSKRNQQCPKWGGIELVLLHDLLRSCCGSLVGGTGLTARMSNPPR